jgi:Uma2 family endonuclease
MATVEQSKKLMTVEEYASLPPSDSPTELVQGRIIDVNVPRSRHGEVCAAITEIVRSFVRKRKLGRVFSNDAGVITERQPDSLRGADVSFYSYARAPRGRIDPRIYLDAAPNVVFEVRSPDDRTSEVLEKVAEYLHAGVDCVCVFDTLHETVSVYEETADAAMLVLQVEDTLTLRQIHDDFRVRVGEFFDDE